MIRLSLRGALAAALLLSALPGAVATAAEDPREMAQLLGFDTDQMRKVVAGGIVAVDGEETTQSQLAVSVAMFTATDLDTMADTMLEGATFRADPGILAFGKIDPADPGRALAEVGFGDGDAEEVERLLAAEPGSDLNLSSGEIATLRAVAEAHAADEASDPAVVEAVSKAYRGILAARLGAYLEHGLEGIAPYQRGDGEISDPAEELIAAADAMQLLQKAAPELYRPLLDYPKEQPDHLKHAFFWLKRKTDDRPAFALVHSMVQRLPDRVILLARAFYVGHTFNDSQVMASAWPYQRGNLILYTNRTSSDEVTGTLQALRHEMGRAKVRKNAIESLEAAREVWGG